MNDQAKPYAIKTAPTPRIVQRSPEVMRFCGYTSFGVDMKMDKSLPCEWMRQLHLRNACFARKLLLVWEETRYCGSSM